MREDQQSFTAEQGVFFLDNLESMSQEINNVRGMCGRLRTLLDEGTYKLDAVLKIINGVKTKEQEIIATGGDPTVLQQMNEEQIDNLLEMLKTPAFQRIARQLLTQWINTAGK